MAECGVGANLFLFPEQYTDVASIGAVASTTGGEIFFHPKFNPVRDRDTLHNEIRRVLSRETIYNVYRPNKMFQWIEGGRSHRQFLPTITHGP